MEQAEKGMNKENDDSKQYEDPGINLFPQAPGATPVLNHYNSPPVSYNLNNRRYGTYDSSPKTTYYIWSYDGKLLAEYDTNGNCKKDYIYLGNKLIAEYKPQSGTYYYYMQDNTNSVRIITNNARTVVYSSAYGPYGDSLKTWVNTYNPDLKYSSKQREEWSDIDYFGARYYDSNSFRFTSPDPIKINKERTYKPWLLNLYAYTRNNPMSYVDMDGRVEVNVNIKEYPINYSIEANKTCGSLACVKIMTKGSSTCFKNSDNKWYPNFNIGFNFNVYYWNNINMKNKYFDHAYG